MIKENHFVLFDDIDGELKAYVFKNEHDVDPYQAIPVPTELAQRIHDWVQQVAPEICLEPDHRAPDCLFKAVKKS